MSSAFSDTDPVKAANKVVAAIREENWSGLQTLLASTPGAAGNVDPWRTQTPQILEGPEIQTIPPFMNRYAGKTLVRYPLQAQFDGQKLEVIVEQRGGDFFAIDFWGFGWP